MTVYTSYSVRYTRFIPKWPTAPLLNNHCFHHRGCILINNYSTIISPFGMPRVTVFLPKMAVSVGLGCLEFIRSPLFFKKTGSVATVMCSSYNC